MKGSGYILSKTKLTVVLLSVVIIVICIVDIHMNKVTVTQTTVDPTIEYGLTAGAIEKTAQMTTIEPVVEEHVVELVEEEAPQWIEMDVPSNNSFKSYMDCSTITDTSSAQYALKYEYLSSASGIMVVEDRFVIALGSYYTTEVGCRVDLVMANGNVIPCIVGDCKADKHTDSMNRQHSVDKSVVEFIVATDNLSDEVRLHGDVSYADSRLMGEIDSIRVYINN